MKQTLMDAAAEARLSELEARVAALESAPKRGRKPKQEEAPVEEPVAEEPVVEEPTPVEEPVAEEPAVEEPVAEEVVAAEQGQPVPQPEEPVAE
jgi:hypothetical protein